MSNPIVHPSLLQYAVELGETLEGMYDRHDMDSYGVVDVRVYIDGKPAVRFYEEGIQFYPEEIN